MRNVNVKLLVLFISTAPLLTFPCLADRSTLMPSNLVEKAKQGAVIAKVKASILDRKDIRSRYIRVRYDGTTLQLSGFVKDREQGNIVAYLARKHEPAADILTFWTYEADLEEHEPYKTRVGEQASDAEVWAKVRASLCSPAAKGALCNADVQAIDVRRGKVSVFLIIDAPPDDVDLAPYITTIKGVSEFVSHKVKAYKTPLLRRLL